MTAATKAPTECEVFQMLILVASSCGGTQLTIRWLHGAKPQPWKIWLMMYSTDMIATMPPMKSGPPVSPVIQVVSFPDQPKMKLTATQTPSPRIRCQRALVRSPMTPLMSLETP